MFSKPVWAVLAVTVGFVQSYKIDLYLGRQCRGAGEGQIRPPNRNQCIGIDTQAESAYIVNNKDNDKNFELLFYSGDGCSGQIVAGATGSGCLTFDGAFNSLEVRRIRKSKRGSEIMPGTMMDGVQAANNILRMNNITVEGDDAPMGEGWLDLGLGHYIEIPGDMTRYGWAEYLDTIGFVESQRTEAQLIDLSDEVVDDAPLELGDQLMPGTSSNEAALMTRNFMGAKCSRTVTCAFAVTNTIETSYNAFAKIYDNVSTNRLWGVLNNAYVVQKAGKWFWNKTTGQPEASVCDKSDKQCLRDALGDNYDQYPKQRIDTRNEKIEVFETSKSGHVEWQATQTKPMTAKPFTC